MNILLVNELRIEFGSLFVYLLLTDIKMLVKLRPLLRFYRINFTVIYEMRLFLRFCDLILADVFEPSHSSVVEFDVMVSADGSGGIRLLQVIRNVVIGMTSTRDDWATIINRKLYVQVRTIFQKCTAFEVFINIMFLDNYNYYPVPI